MIGNELYIWSAAYKCERVTCFNAAAQMTKLMCPHYSQCSSAVTPQHNHKGHRAKASVLLPLSLWLVFTPLSMCE
jgi:hypothetical protein